MINKFILSGIQLNSTLFKTMSSDFKTLFLVFCNLRMLFQCCDAFCPEIQCTAAPGAISGMWLFWFFTPRGNFIAIRILLLQPVVVEENNSLKWGQQKYSRTYIVRNYLIKFTCERSRARVDVCDESSGRCFVGSTFVDIACDNLLKRKETIYVSMFQKFNFHSVFPA